ncbi:MAG: outer membrane beta-barrel protein [Geothrix sp.]|uniref:outer membrane beta-barrel protein n=1 Tax=Geothrix sp. TaxID=1962974 RepID=UPI003BB01D21
MKCLALLPLLLVLPLVAQDRHRPTYGLSVQFNAPLGDLKEDTDQSLGVGASVLAQWNLAQGHALRSRMDVNVFQVSRYEPSNSNYRESRSLSAVGFGVDYLYHLSGRPVGLYLTGGAGITRWDLTTTTSDKVGSSYASSYERNRNTTSLSLAAGLGWQFTRIIGLETRFIHSPYKTFDLGNPTSTTRTDVNRDGNFLQVAGTFRW